MDNQIRLVERLLSMHRPFRTWYLPTLVRALGRPLSMALPCLNDVSVRIPPAPLFFGMLLRYPERHKRLTGEMRVQMVRKRTLLPDKFHILMDLVPIL